MDHVNKKNIVYLVYTVLGAFDILVLYNYGLFLLSKSSMTFTAFDCIDRSKWKIFIMSKYDATVYSLRKMSIAVISYSEQNDKR